MATNWIILLNIFLFYFIEVLNADLPGIIQIGALFEHGNENLEMAFKTAIQNINDDQNILPNSRLVGRIETFANEDSMEASNKVCDLLSQGVSAIFGPQSADICVHIDSICEAYHMPHIITHWNPQLPDSSQCINLMPHASTYYKLFAELIREWGWTSYAILYEDNDGLIRLKDLVYNPKLRISSVTIRQLPPGDDYHNVLEEMKDKQQFNIIVDSSISKIFTVLKQAQQLGMMGEEYHYLLTNIDAETTAFEDFRYSKTSITFARLLNLEAINIYKEKALENDKINAYMALVYDSVIFFAHSIHNLGKTANISISKFSCDEEASTWPNGSLIINQMKTEILQNGLTGSIQMDDNNVRSTFDVGVMSVERSEIQYLTKVRVTEEKNHGLQEILNPKTGIDADKHLKIMAVLSQPFVMLKNSSNVNQDKESYEGFCIDLLTEFSEILGFDYKISLVPDNSYGVRHSDTKQWIGIIGELHNRRADMGIGDITISKHREEVVDFSMPFMHVGLGFLLKKPQPDQGGIFYFMTPFSLQLWLSIALAYFVLTAILFVLARLSPSDWQAPHPCIREPQYLLNNLGFMNSLWFVLASLMHQWSKLVPKGISTRLATVTWWIFVLIMTCSYTANLMKNLMTAVDKIESPINDVHDLLRQSEIKFGLIRGGATMAFMQNAESPIISQVWNRMIINDPSQSGEGFLRSVNQGLEKVMQGNFAFILESPANDYITERNCDLMKLDLNADHKGYAIAFPKGSPLRSNITEILLRLQERQILQKLKAKWWGNVRSRGHCDSLEKTITALNSRHLSGIFFIFLASLILACGVAILEVMWKWRNKHPNARESTLCQEITNELKFAVDFRNNKKVIKESRLIEATGGESRIIPEETSSHQ